ncbi:RICIN domain-containing protein [Streptomyces europaeiscabiei]|uniref:RICIN domain-containing protein n=1 Tax=Streptomyces europaeiscabiei TaxID=146819 RepID=UPI002E2E80EA|nr:RICIN domain-containing protein [Streptomyces europaeiscabiei]
MACSAPAFAAHATPPRAGAPSTTRSPPTRRASAPSPAGCCARPTASSPAERPSSPGFPPEAPTALSSSAARARTTCSSTRRTGPRTPGPVQGTPSAADSQKWTLVEAGDGYYELKNVNSGLHAGVAQSSTSNGAAVVQWNDVNVDDQLWKIVRIN